jgi:hypothetical protein
MRRGKRALLLVLLLACGPSWADEADEESFELSVTLNADRLSVRARAVPLLDILDEIGRVSGVRVYVEPAVELQMVAELTSTALENVTVEEGLRRVLQNKNFMLGYSASGLTQVRIYREGRRDLGRAAPASRAGRKSAIQPPAGVPNDPASIVRLKNEALGGSDPGARATAFSHLAGADQKVAMETALMILDRDRDPQVLGIALEMVLAQESPPLEPLFKFVATGRDPGLRAQALEVLSSRGQRDPRIRKLLTTLATTEANPELRETAKSLLEDLDSE